MLKGRGGATWDLEGTSKVASEPMSVNEVALPAEVNITMTSPYTWTPKLRESKNKTEKLELVNTSSEKQISKNAVF